MICAIAEERLDVVEVLMSDSELRQSLRGNHLRHLPDLHRLSSRLQRRNASLQDCYRVYQAVGVLPELVEALETSTAVQQRPELCANLFTNPIKVCSKIVIITAVCMIALLIPRRLCFTWHLSVCLFVASRKEH